jgi:hypothetical protein
MTSLKTGKKKIIYNKRFEIVNFYKIDIYRVISINERYIVLIKSFRFNILFNQP